MAVAQQGNNVSCNHNHDPPWDRYKPTVRKSSCQARKLYKYALRSCGEGADLDRCQAHIQGNKNHWHAESDANTHTLYICSAYGLSVLHFILCLRTNIWANMKTVACPRVFINASGGMLENTLNRCTFDMLTKGRNLDGGPKRKTRCAWRGVVGVYTGGQHCSTEASNYKFWVRDSWTIRCG